MANLKVALEKTLKFEGWYSNDPEDPGAETFRGISRRYHPLWPGWARVDHHRVDGPAWTLTARLMQDRSLDIPVALFYKEQFWDKFRGEELVSQNLANEMFDISVNLGWDRAVRWVQFASNLLNRGDKEWPVLRVDGVFGPKTLEAVNQYVPVASLIKLLNILQGAYYIEKCAENPEKRKFLRGWISRVL